MTSLPIIQCTDEQGAPNCGACCMTVGLPPFVFREYVTMPAGDAFDKLEALVIDGDPRLNQPCAMLDLATKRCTIYEHRPQICRSFDIGGEHCRAARKREGITT